MPDLMALRIDLGSHRYVVPGLRRRREAVVGIECVGVALVLAAVLGGLLRALRLGALVALARTLGARALRVVDDPVATLARLSDGLGLPAEALVQREVVANGVLCRRYTISATLSFRRLQTYLPRLIVMVVPEPVESFLQLLIDLLEGEAFVRTTEDSELREHRDGISRALAFRWVWEGVETHLLARS